MRKSNNIEGRRRVTKKLQLLLISYLIMTQAVPTSLPNAVGTITAFAETVEKTADASGGKYVVNGEENGTYNIENTDNSSVHAKGNDITVEVNGDTREVYFDGNKQGITVKGNTESIKNLDGGENTLHVTGDVVKSDSANDIQQNRGSTVVEGSANVGSIGIYNGASLSTGYNNDGTSSGKSGDITASGSINASFASSIKADGDISANNINIEGTSNDIGSKVEATGDVSAHHITMSKNSELIAKGVEATKDPNDSNSGNIELYSGSTIRTTQDGIKARSVCVDNSTVDSQNIDTSLSTKIKSSSQVNGNITSDSANVLVQDNSTVTGDIDVQGQIIVEGNSTVNGDVNSRVNLVKIGDKSTVNGNVTCGIWSTAEVVGGSTVTGNVTSETGKATVTDSSVGGDINAKGRTEIRRSTVTGKTTANNKAYVYSSNTGDLEGQYVIVQKDRTDGSRSSTGNITSTKGKSEISDTDVHGNIISEGDAIVADSTVSGDINAKNATTVKNSTVGGDIHGNIQSNANVEVKDNSTVEGNVSGQKVNIEDSDIGGAVTGTDDTTMTNSTVGGNIEGKSVQLTGVTQDTTADTEVASKNGASIHDSSVGAITNSESGVVDVDNSTTKDITNSSTKANDPEALSTTVINNSTVNGNVETQSGAEIHGNTHITGNVETSKSSELEHKTNLNIDGEDTGTVKIDGNINTNGDYAGINHAEIGGTINTAGLSVENSTVHKGITATGDVWVSNSSTKEIVNGCERYTGVENSTIVSDGVAIDSGYVSVDNSNITGDINAAIDTIGNANVDISDSTVNGNITAPHLVTEVSNSTVNSIDGKAVKIKDNSTVHGDINTTSYTKVNDSQVEGTIQSGAEVELTNTTTKDVNSDYTINATNSTINGDAVAKSEVALISSQVEGDTVSGSAGLSGSTVKGSVSTEGTAYVENNSHIDGDVTSTVGNAIIYDSTVKGSVSAERNIEFRQASIDGDATSMNENAIITDSSIGGNVNVKNEKNEKYDSKSITEIRRSTVAGKTVANNGIYVYSSNTGDIEGRRVFTQKDETDGSRSSTGNITSTVGMSDIKDTDVHGSITSEDKVEVTDSTVSGSVDAKKNVTLKNSTVSGDVHGNITSSSTSASKTTIDNSTVKSVSGDRVNIENNSTIQGDVNSKYGATVDSSNVKGELKSDKYAKVTNSTVDGKATVGTTLTSNEATFNDDVEAETVKADGKLLVKGDFKATTVQFNAGSKVDVLGNYTADRLDADNNTVYVKGDSNTKSIIARDGHSAKVDGTAIVGNQNTLLNTVTSDNGTVEVGELVIKQNTGNTDTNIQATNGGTITVNSDLDTTEAIASASKSGKGIKLEADGGNSVIHIKGDVSDTNKDNKSVGMNVVATNNGTIQIDGDAEGKYTADGGTVNISGTAKTKLLDASNGGNIHVAGNVDNKYNDYIKANNSVVNVDDTITGLARITVSNDGTVSAKNGIGAQTAQVTNKSTLKSEGDIKINDTLAVNNGSVTTDKKFTGSYTSVFKDGNLSAKEGIETDTLSVGNIGGSTVSTLGSIIADNIRSAYSTGELGDRNKVTANDTIKGAINTKSTMGLGYVGTDFESNKVEITGKSDMEDTNIKANELAITARDGAQPDMKMSGGVLDISGNIKIEGVLYNNDSVAKMSLNDTDVKIGGTVTSTVEGHSSQLEVNGGEHNNSLVLNKGTDNVSVKTDKASADIKGDVTVANENESGAVQVKEGNLKLTDGNLVYTTSNNEEVKVNHGDIELSSKDAIQLIETGHDVVLLENYNVSSTGNGIAGSFEKLAIDDKSSLTAKGTGIRSLAETAEITAQTDVIGDEYGVESGSQLKYTTADSVIGGKAAFLKDDFTKQDDITVWEAKGEKVIDSKNGTATAEQIEKAEKEIKYVIKQSETENGTIEIIPTIGTVSLTGSDGVEKTYNVALQDQIVRVKIIPDTGYQVKSTSGRTAELKSVGDNIYELKVPRGGGVNISALMEAIVDDTKNNNNNNNNNNTVVDDNNTNNNNTGVDDNDTDNKNNNNEPIPTPSIPQTPVLNGNYYGDSGSDSYEYGPAHETYDDQHMWTTTMHGTFKESPQGKKFIGLDGVEVTGCVQIAEGDGKYNWYLFDSDGLMQTGWHTLRDGKWYYFYADGHMAKDEVTPDGCYVDYTGAWEEVEHVELAE